MPKVSILLTTYNHLAHLPACLASVRAQTFRDYEILALDDGSTDGTREWLQANAPEAKLLFHAENLGTYASLNRGLDHAQGAYVAILNDDDLWAPQKLESQLAQLESHPEFTFSHTGGGFIGPEGEPVQNNPLGFPFPNDPSGDLLPGLIERNRVIASSALIPRARLQPFDPSFYGCGDWHQWLRLARQGPIGFVSEPLTFYRVHPGNAALNHQKMFEDSRRIREWIAGWESEYAADPRPALRRAFALNWAALGVERAWLGDRRGARTAYTQSVRRAPWRLKTWARLIRSGLPI